MRRFWKTALAVFLVSAAVFLETPCQYTAETPVRVAVDPSLPPYQFIRDGECVGTHIDLLNRLAENSGLTLSYYPMANTTECMDALDRGEVDMVLGVILPARGSGALFYTQAVSQSSICMVIRDKDIDRVLNQDSGMTATYQDGTISMSFIKNFKTLRYIPVSSQQRAFELLTRGDANAMVGVRSSLLYQLEQSHLDDQYTIISNYMIPIEFSIKVRDGDRDLLRKLNDGLYRLRISGDYEQIHSQWVEDDADRYQELVQRAARVFLAAAAIAAAVIFFNLRLNHLLKRKVAEQTQTIRQANHDLQRQILETQKSNQVRNYIVESSPSGIIVFDRAFNITLFNNSACRLFDGAKLAAGQSVRQIPLVEKLLCRGESELFTPSAQFRNIEIAGRSSDGRNLSYRASMYLLNDPAENEPARGAILTIEDVTKENQLKEQEFERQKNLALNRMVASVAHEIRNPLMSIKTYAELIPAKRNNAAFQEQMAQYLPREVDRINGLVSSLIDYAKPRSQTRERVSVPAVIESCALLIEPMLKNKAIRLETSLEDGLEIVIDPGRLKQVVINLLLNGVEAIDEKRAKAGGAGLMDLKVHAYGEKRRCLIEISDQGVGMTEEQMRCAVEPFFTTKAGGTGLGLSLCKQFAEENGGSLQIWSEAGLGTKIVLTFERNES